MGTKKNLRIQRGDRQRNVSSQDEYRRIYALIRRRAYATALNHMVQESTGRLTKDFSNDKNHSWFVVGDILYRIKDYTRALIAFKRALKAWNKDSEAMWAIADCFSELGRYKLAEKYYRLANRSKPNDIILFNLGNSLFDQNKFIAAIRIYDSIKSNDKSLIVKIGRNIELANMMARKIPAKKHKK